MAWEAPRSLLLEVLPTMRRRLASGWASDGTPGADFQIRWQPLPDFVPANLFSDLNLPETRIQLPPAQRDSEETETQAPVLQALRTFAPGRISRRYSVEHRYVRHWVPVPLDTGTAELEVSAFADGTDLGHVHLRRWPGRRDIPMRAPLVHPHRATRPEAGGLDQRHTGMALARRSPGPG